MLLSVVIPMYNEKTIAKDCAFQLVKKLESDAAALSFEYEIIFFDDGSSDGCGDVVRRFAENTQMLYGRIIVDRSEINCGKGNAVRRGILSSSGDVVVFTDCDLAYGCDVIIDMFKKFVSAECTAELLIGSRTISPDGYKGYTFMRRLASEIYVKLLKVCAGFNHSDSQCGIKMFKGESARRIFSLCETDKWAFDFEALLIAERLGMKIDEFPVFVINHRDSKVRLFRDSIKMMSDIGKIKRRVEHLKITE